MLKKKYVLLERQLFDFKKGIGMKPDLAFDKRVKVNALGASKSKIVYRRKRVVKKKK